MKLGIISISTGSNLFTLKIKVQGSSKTSENFTNKQCRKYKDGNVFGVKISNKYLLDWKYQDNIC
jgi:hypothetical protein